MIASRSRSAAGSAKTIRPSAARSSVPSARRRSSPNRAMTASSAGSPGSTTSRATWSASMTTTPGRSPSQPATVDFPQPIGPVSPIRTADASRRPLLELQPGILRRRQRDIDVRQLARHPPHLHEIRLHSRIPHRQLQVILPQAQAASAPPQPPAFCRRYASFDSFSFFPLFLARCGWWCRARGPPAGRRARAGRSRQACRSLP